jgi:hypothetical protein
MNRIFYSFLMLFLLFLFSCKEKTTEPEIEDPWGWAEHFDGGNSCMLYSVQQTDDGSFIVVGNKGGSPGGAWLIKTDSDGDTLWTRTFSESYGYSIRQTIDGGYVIAGERNNDFLLIKTNGEGDTLWNETYGGGSEDKGRSVKQTTDGGYIIAGYTESYGAGNRDVYLVKTDLNGNLLWSYPYGGTENDVGNSVDQTNDGGFIVAGVTLSFGSSADVYLIKTNSDGDTLWTKTYCYSSTSEDLGFSVQQTNDNGYIIVGYTNTYLGHGIDAYLIRTDSLGDTLWTRIYGGTAYDCGSSVQQTTDGGFIITGETRSDGTSGTGDVWLIKTDNNGDLQWTWTYSTQISDDRGLEVQQTTDGGFILVGFEDWGGSRTKGILIRKY